MFFKEIFWLAKIFPKWNKFEKEYNKGKRNRLGWCIQEFKSFVQMKIRKFFAGGKTDGPTQSN